MSRYTGFQIIVDTTGRDLDAIWEALEEVLCDLPPDGDDCRVEMLATCTHEDFDVVHQWLTGDDDGE